MKKILFFVVLALLAVSLRAEAITPVYSGSGLGTLKTVTLINNSTAPAKTSISTSYVIPKKCQLLGWSANDIKGGSSTEVVVGIADATSGDTDSYLMGESEAANKESIDKVLPKPYEVTTGLEVRQGAFTCVTLYYVQVRP